MPDQQRGFTLIEVLIAMAATMLILSAAYGTFSTLLNGLEVLRRATDATHELNRAWMFVGRDLRQFINRPIRDEFGDVESALWGGELAADSLILTRTGWHNGRDQLRGSMERVRYQLEDGTLYRDSYAVLDRTDVNEPRQVALLSNVERFELRFLDPQATIQPGGEWDTDRWPLNWGVNNRETGLVNPPAAVLVTLDIEGLGEIQRLYEVPGV